MNNRRKNTSLPPSCGIIPARYASSRFPGKPLAVLLGKPMFWHVYTRARQCRFLDSVYLATDDARIYDKAKELDVPVLMTSDAHTSGTDRVYEAARTLNLPDDSIVVNIQGDEPALAPEMLDQLIRVFEDPLVKVATLAHSPSAEEETMLESEDRVKVATNLRDNALYFSRALIPWSGTGVQVARLLHIGIYAFRLPELRQFVTLPRSPLEQSERLEQLRLLDNEIPIRVVRTEHRCHGVDRPADIAVLEALLRENQICKPS